MPLKTIVTMTLVYDYVSSSTVRCPLGRNVTNQQYHIIFVFNCSYFAKGVTIILRYATGPWFPWNISGPVGASVPVTPPGVC